MAKYWSDAVMLKKIHVPVVVATSDAVFVANFISALEILLKKPEASITPPKHMAQIISHTVFNIPNIPPVLRSPLIISLSVVILVSLLIASIIVIKEALK